MEFMALWCYPLKLFNWFHSSPNSANELASMEPIIRLHIQSAIELADMMNCSSLCQVAIFAFRLVNQLVHINPKRCIDMKPPGKLPIIDAPHFNLGIVRNRQFARIIMRIHANVCGVPFTDATIEAMERSFTDEELSTIALNPLQPSVCRPKQPVKAIFSLNLCNETGPIKRFLCKRKLRKPRKVPRLFRPETVTFDNLPMCKFIDWLSCVYLKMARPNSGNDSEGGDAHSIALVNGKRPTAGEIELQHPEKYDAHFFGSDSIIPRSFLGMEMLLFRY